MNPNLIYEHLIKIADLSEDDEERIRYICENAAQTLTPYLKDGYTGNEPDAVFCAATLAFYRYAILKQAEIGAMGIIKTGDVTITHQGKAVLDAAERLVADAFKYSKCFTDIGHFFRRIGD